MNTLSMNEIISDNNSTMKKIKLSGMVEMVHVGATSDW